MGKGDHGGLGGGIGDRVKGGDLADSARLGLIGDKRPKIGISCGNGAVTMARRSSSELVDIEGETNTTGVGIAGAVTTLASMSCLQPSTSLGAASITLNVVDGSATDTKGGASFAPLAAGDALSDPSVCCGLAFFSAVCFVEAARNDPPCFTLSSGAEVSASGWNSFGGSSVDDTFDEGDGPGTSPAVGGGSDCAQGDGMSDTGPKRALVSTVELA